MSDIHAKYTELIRAKNEEIRRRYECSHVGLTEIRRRVNAAGTITIAEQCRRCGAHIKALPKRAYSPAMIDAMHPYDENRAAAWWDSKRNDFARWAAYYQEQQECELGQAQAERRRFYEQYIRSYEWKAKAALVRKRAAGVCEGCGQRPPVNVHHLTYDHLGNEFLWELAAVCRECHERAHGIEQSESA